MLAEWTLFTQVSGVQRCPRSSRQVAADDLSRPGEVTAAPGKPIAPSGEPGDKLMPLLKSVEHHPREVLSMCDKSRPKAASDFWTCAAGPPRAGAVHSLIK